MSVHPHACVPRSAHSGAAAAVLCTEEDSSCAAALGLQHVLQSVLSNLPVRHRLWSAALVCQQWSTVAGAVTADEGIHMVFGSEWNADEPRQESPEVIWMGKYGHSITGITICNGPIFVDEPMPFMSTLSRLTTLELCCMTMSPKVLSCLAGSMKELRRLSLRHMHMDVWDETAQETILAPYHKPWQEVWAGCPQLTFIKVESSRMDGPALKGIGALQHLQELVLIGNPLGTASYLNPLPPSLTSLSVQGDTDGYSSTSRVDFSAALSQQMHHAGPGKLTGDASMPGSSLLYLHIPATDLHEPSGLSSLTSLTALHAHGLHSNKRRELLAVLPCLHNLCHLDLGIQQTSGYSICGNDTHQSPCFGTADLERLVYGCPDLEGLSIAAMPSRPVQPRHAWAPREEPEPCSLLPLQGATRLTKLTLWASQLLQDSHLGELATLTALKSLRIPATGHFFTDKGVQQLSQLTALTSLWMDAVNAQGVSNEVASYSRCVFINSSSDEKAGPDCQSESVSQQLASRCARSKVLHPRECSDADETHAADSASNADSASDAGPSDELW